MARVDGGRAEFTLPRAVFGCPVTDGGSVVPSCAASPLTRFPLVAAIVPFPCRAGWSFCNSVNAVPPEIHKTNDMKFSNTS